MLELETKITLDADVAKSPNLCNRFSDADLEKIGRRCREGYVRDLASRQSWYERNEAGMDLALQVAEAKSFPWPGCANVVFPLVSIAALQFGARSYGNLIQGTDIVRYRNAGDDPKGLDRIRADRIGKHMSWQVLEEDQAWEEQHDRLFINLSIVGTAFIKSYFSHEVSHNVSELVLAKDLVVNYWSKSIDKAPRATHIIPRFRNELHEKYVKKIFRDCSDEGWYKTAAPVTEQQQSTQTADQRRGVVPGDSDYDTPFITCEQHCNLDLDCDGYAEPYIVTFKEDSGWVFRIVARWEREEDIQREGDEIASIKPSNYFTKFGFIPAMDGGFYDVGFGTLLGPLNESVNTGINQLLDAGTMSNSQGGFLGRGAKIRGGVYTMAPWEWKRVDSTGDDLRKSLVQLPVREPSSVLFQLLSLMIEYTDRVSGATDQMMGKNPGQNTPAETSRNMTEQGMQVYSTIFKRVWRSMKEEFKKLHLLNRQYLVRKQNFGSGASFALKEDYYNNPDNVVPCADPNLTSQSMRVGQAQMLCERATVIPGYDLVETERNLLKALRIEGADKFYPGPGKTPPLPDPKSQVQAQKNQLEQAKLDWEKKKFMLDMMEERKVNEAKIAMLQAEAMSLVHGMNAEDKAHQLQVFETFKSALVDHNAMLTDRIHALSTAQKVKNDAHADGNFSGGVPGVEAGPSDQAGMGADGPPTA